MTNFFKHKMRSKSIGEIIGWVLFGILGIAALAILFAFVVMWLWNWLAPDIFGLPTLTFWQAVGMVLLFKLLFGGFGGSGKSHSSSKRSKSSCDKEPKGEFSKWKHYDQFWKEEGDAAYQRYLQRLDNETNDEVANT
ncbi:hypothetical protein WIW50_02950 [Flavobacteriaceae bacterium 3-367]|uniref:hypothetical protein n=1 Tax=Eudoraea algarum TaxID=3417568 RepID=UPI00326920B5